MPRTGGIYSVPVASRADATSGTAISSAPYRALLDDLEADANLARPITAGGTGSSTAAGARTNLGLGALATLGSVGLAQIDLNAQSPNGSWRSKAGVAFSTWYQNTYGKPIQIAVEVAMSVGGEVVMDINSTTTNFPVMNAQVATNQSHVFQPIIPAGHYWQFRILTGGVLYANRSELR